MSHQLKAMEKIESLALAAALNAEPDPTKAVALVKAMIRSAALAEGNEVTATITLKIHEPGDNESISILGIPCVVCAQVCLPFVGCISQCVVPPGGDGC